MISQNSALEDGLYTRFVHLSNPISGPLIFKKVLLLIKIGGLKILWLVLDGWGSTYTYIKICIHKLEIQGVLPAHATATQAFKEKFASLAVEKVYSVGGSYNIDEMVWTGILFLISPLLLVE